MLRQLCRKGFCSTKQPNYFLRHQSSSANLKEALNQHIKKNLGYDLNLRTKSGEIELNTKGNITEDEYWLRLKESVQIYRQLGGLDSLDDDSLLRFVTSVKDGIVNYRLVPFMFQGNHNNNYIDSGSNNIGYILTGAIREISYSLINDDQQKKRQLDSRVLRELIETFNILGFSYEIVFIWHSLRNVDLFNHAIKSQQTLKSIMKPLIATGDYEFDDIWRLYNDTLAIKGDDEPFDQDLAIMMVKICLINNKVAYALKLFNEVSPENTRKFKIVFVQYCKDMDVASKLFFELESTGDLQLTGDALAGFIQNMWDTGHDYEAVRESLSHAEGLELLELSKVIKSFASIFFEKFPSYSNESFIELEKLLKKFKQPALVHFIVSSSSTWRNPEVFVHLLSSCDRNNLKLNSLFLEGSLYVDVDSEVVLGLVNDRLRKKTIIKLTDWNLIRDATINSPYLFSFNTPNDRINLYFKLWKICSPYLESLETFKEFIYKDIKLNSKYSKVYQNLDLIENDLKLANLKNFTKNLAIDSFVG